MRPKVLLVTIFDTINFGTYLQAFATGVKLQQLGAQVEILWYERPWHRFKTPLNRFFSCLKIFDLIYAKLRKNKGYLQKCECREFVEKYVPITKLYSSYEDLKKNPPKADVYLTGSDQVWNTFHNKGIEPVYYLDFVHDKFPKVAFSASIGMNDWDERYKEESLRLLRRYSFISVRESQAVELLKSENINSSKVVDPTFLLSREEWSKYAKPFVNNKPYVLVYSVEWGECDEVISKTARQVANSMGGDVIEVNYTGAFKQIPDCDKRFYYATPDQFLSLMLGASFCVVSSFHGTAFSINLRIPFISVAPERFSSRIDSLLTQTGTYNRKVNEYDPKIIESLINENINFSFVEKVMSEEIQKSVQFIEKKILN